jgi:cell division protein FtsL
MSLFGRLTGTPARTSRARRRTTLTPASLLPRRSLWQRLSTHPRLSSLASRSRQVARSGFDRLPFVGAGATAAAPARRLLDGPEALSLIHLLVGACTIAALLHVWVHLQVIAVGYDISKEARYRHDLSEQQERLRIELRTRMDLAQIERVAREELKMGSPDARAIRVLKVAPALLATAAEVVK